MMDLYRDIKMMSPRLFTLLFPNAILSATEQQTDVTEEHSDTSSILFLSGI